MTSNTPGAAIPVGNGPFGVAITPDGQTAYVANRGDSTVTPIAVATNTSGTPIPVGSHPYGLAITPAPPLRIIAPSISGTALQGQTLTAGHGRWTGNPTGYREQWQDCDHLGAACAAIPGATSQTYTLTAADVGHTIRVQETASNAAGTGSPASSPPTTVVSAPTPPPTSTTTTPSTTPPTSTTPTPTPPITSAPAMVTGPSCAPASGSLTATRLGPVALGMTRHQAHTALPAYHVTDNGFDRSCSADGQNRIRVGYPTNRLLTTLTPHQRTQVRGRVVLALTANPHYALNTIKPGTPITALPPTLARMQRFQIGRNTWYVITGTHAAGILKVQTAPSKNRNRRPGADHDPPRAATATPKLLTHDPDPEPPPPAPAPSVPSHVPAQQRDPITGPRAQPDAHGILDEATNTHAGASGRPQNRLRSLPSTIGRLRQSSSRTKASA